MKPQIIITFDREKKNHSVEFKEVNGMEILLAIQSLGDKVNKETGLGIEDAMAGALLLQEEEKGEE